MAKKTTTKKSKVGKTSKASASRKSAASKTRQTTKTTKAKRPVKTAAKNKHKTTSKAAKAGSLKQLSSVMHGLRGLHLLNVAVYGALIAFIYMLVDGVHRAIMVGYGTSDVLQGSDVLAPAVRQVASIDIRHAVTALLAVGIIYSLYVATKGWDSYQRRAEAGTLASRWIFAVVSGVIALDIVAVMHGVYDLILIKVLAVLLILAGYHAYRSGLAKDKQDKARLFLTAVIASAVVALALVVFIGLSMLYGFQLLPLYVYALADIFALALLGYGVNQLFHMKKRKGFATPMQAERNYVLITSLATLLFAATFVFGFMA
ncbi:MAG: hypothetical protein LC687_07005 [Actinobacteria bacterium]|nr:hypothetical protein [Actinomycetota bacterium]